jgi:hypothetical protein
VVLPVVLLEVVLPEVVLLVVELLAPLAYNQLSLLLPPLLPRKQQSFVSMILFFSHKTSSKIPILNTSHIIHLIIGIPSFRISNNINISIYQ